MKKTSITLLIISALAFSNLVAKAQTDTTYTPTTPALTTKKPGVGTNIKNGTETMFKDLGKGVKKVGTGIEKGAKGSVHATEKGAEKVETTTKNTVSKVSHHKKAGGTSSTTTTTSQSSTESNQ